MKSPAVSTSHEPFHHVVFENDHMRIFNVELPPGESTLLHRHDHDYHVVIVGAADIEDQAENEEPQRVHYSGGEVVSGHSGHVHQVTNVGSQPFRNFGVEVK